MALYIITYDITGEEAKGRKPFRDHLKRELGATDAGESLFYRTDESSSAVKSGEALKKFLWDKTNQSSWGTTESLVVVQVEGGTESLAQAGDSSISQPEGTARQARSALYVVVYDVAANAERAERLESILSDAEKFKALGQSTYATTGGPGEAEEILGRLKQALGGLNEGERLLVARVANVDAALFAEGGKGTEDGREGAKMWAALVK